MSKKREELILGIKMRLAGYGVGNEDAEGVMEYVLSAARDGRVEIPGEEARIKGCYISELGGYRDIIVLCEEQK